MTQSITSSTTAINNTQPSVQFNSNKTSMAIPLPKTKTNESSKSGRSVLAAITDRFRSGSRSRSQSRSRSKDGRLSLDIYRTKSRDSTSSEAKGQYADVILAQTIYMEKLRAEQARNNITHNVDGLPLPPMPEREGRRRSIVHALGFDKPLLAF
ncbi:hypothetical protein BGZ76_004317 [Entomortierella beljakovae]|nr:hypothetical protein BGZ76_004317 [Entomortierella beljakovae]